MSGVENQTTFSADGLDERIQAQQCLEGAQRSGDKADAFCVASVLLNNLVPDPDGTLRVEVDEVRADLEARGLTWAAALSSREQIMVAQEAVDKAESRERGVQNSLTDTSDFLMSQAAAKQAQSTEPK